MGLLLPCNAVVYEREGHTYAGVVDAAKMLAIVGDSSMEPMAQSVNDKLRRALDSLAA